MRHLHVHLATLEAKGYIAVEKTFVGRRPKTFVAVTPAGRPDAARVTLPLNPPMSVTLMVLVALLPAATVSVLGAGESVKLGAGVPKVTNTLAATLGTPCAVKANNQ